MTLIRRAVLGGLLLIASLAASPPAPAVSGRSIVSDGASTLPERLTDQEFWRLSSTLSEQGGTFHSDNFVSNEGRSPRQWRSSTIIRSFRGGNRSLGFGMFTTSLGQILAETRVCAA